MADLTSAALSTYVTTRYGQGKWLVQLTNPDSSTATVNTTVLTAACDDAIATFNMYFRQTAQDSVAYHIMMCCKLAVAHIKNYRDSKTNELNDLIAELEKTRRRYSAGVIIKNMDSDTGVFDDEMDDFKVN